MTHFIKRIVREIDWNQTRRYMYGVAYACLIITAGCSEEENIDTEYPVIITDFEGAFPTQCSSVDKGTAFTFKVRFSDNVELGSFSLDIHHNFDHHTHSTEVNDCDMAPVKTPVNPFVLIKNYRIPQGLREYEATAEIHIPDDIDSGDYHFMILLTDKEGWQSIKGLSIKIN